MKKIDRLEHLPVSKLLSDLPMNENCLLRLDAMIDKLNELIDGHNKVCKEVSFYVDRLCQDEDAEIKT